VARYGARFRTFFSREGATSYRTIAGLDASIRATDSMPLKCSLSLTITTMNCITTLKADEDWSSPGALEECGSRKGSVLWHGMIYPLLKTTIRGAVWYVVVALYLEAVLARGMMEVLVCCDEQHVSTYTIPLGLLPASTWLLIANLPHGVPHQHRYQGEADATHPGGYRDDGYNCTFPTMIADWRTTWSGLTNGAVLFSL
jgi:hypothetical protein